MTHLTPMFCQFCENPPAALLGEPEHTITMGMGVYKPKHVALPTGGAGGIGRLTHKAMRAVFREKNLGSFPSEDDCVRKNTRVSKSKGQAKNDDDIVYQRETPTTFDMSSYEEKDNAVVDYTVYSSDTFYSEEAGDFRCTNTKEEEKVVLLGLQTITKEIALPGKFRRGIHRSVRPLKKGWKKITSSWKREEGNHTGMVIDSASSAHRNSNQSQPRMQRTFSTWTTRRLFKTRSKEYYTETMDYSSSEELGEQDVEVLSETSEPPQFLPGLEPCTTL